MLHFIAEWAIGNVWIGISLTDYRGKNLRKAVIFLSSLSPTFSKNSMTTGCWSFLPGNKEPVQKIFSYNRFTSILGVDFTDNISWWDTFSVCQRFSAINHLLCIYWSNFSKPVRDNSVCRYDEMEIIFALLLRYVLIVITHTHTHTYELQKAEIVSKSKLVPSVFIKTHYWIHHR